MLRQNLMEVQLGHAKLQSSRIGTGNTGSDHYLVARRIPSPCKNKHRRRERGIVCRFHKDTMTWSRSFRHFSLFAAVGGLACRTFFSPVHWNDLISFCSELLSRKPIPQRSRADRIWKTDCLIRILPLTRSLVL